MLVADIVAPCPSRELVSVFARVTPILKAGKVALLFWNGQALGEPALKPIGKHFAAEILFTQVSELDPAAMRRWLVKAGKKVFKDYAALRKDS